MIFVVQACDEVVPMYRLVSKDCKIFSKKKLFTGKYELKKGDKYILGKVARGELKNEKTFKNDILLMEKDFDSCQSGFQKVFDINGNKVEEGSFLNGKRIGKWKYFLKDSVYNINY